MNTQTHSGSAATTIADLRAAFLAVREMPAALLETERSKHSIKEAKSGSYLRFDGNVYLVEEKSEYREGKWKWYELKLVSLLDKRTIFLEWELDDKLEAAIWETGLVRWSELGLTAGTLKRFDDEEEGHFAFQGLTYAYDESDKALWVQGCQGSGIPFYYYDFYQKGGNKLLSVEQWEDGKFDVSLGYAIDPKRVEMLVI